MIQSDAQKVLADLDANEVGFRRLMDGLTDAHLNWQPNGGHSWSIVQCLDHLTRSNDFYMAAMRNAAPRSGVRGAVIRPSMPGRLFIERLEPPVKQKFPTHKALVPPSSQDPAAALTAFLNSHQDIRAFVRSVDGLDLNRMKFRNPIVPLLRVRVGTGLLIVAAHERRHLWQAEQVRQQLT